ncbi:alpha/beta hydrolase [Roseateles violae]|uniref:Alpha/beta hydrolase n=1 Tax=Roseateles violae TaxID=3058042 RepID=A0ABT8DUC2_9BURK|nr:alpha/beta hydrolase [Pelomonas sp. PFR6]MDN3921603.1 alpha/beta hydrolase [Pelomonas sp. PFR6]
MLLLPLAALWLLGDRLSAPAQHEVGVPPAALKAEALRIPSAAGQIGAWFAPGRPGSGAVLLLHGVRGDRRAMLGRARFLHEQGFAVLLIDLPAHGESRGERISFGQREGLGVRAALDWLGRCLPGEKIAVIGVSLGAASYVLLEPRPEPAPAAVVLESMYPTIDEAVADRLALHLGEPARALAPLLLLQLPWRLDMSAGRLRPIDRIARLGSPLLLVAGDRDRHTLLAETRALYAAAAEPKSLWIVEGAAHIDLHAFDAAAYEARVGAFLRERLRPPG